MSSVSFKKAVFLKEGMTRVFDSEGKAQPVTVLRILDTRVARVIKSGAASGDKAKVQLFASKKNGKSLSELDGLKALNKNLKKLGIITYELATAREGLDSLAFNDAANLTLDTGSLVDVTSISKGKGFQGVIKRHGFAGGPASHGSQFHRRSGSIGNRATPARVFAQKKMPGRMGSDKITVKNLSVIAYSLEKGYALIKGAIPGHKGSEVLVSVVKK